MQIAESDEAQGKFMQSNAHEGMTPPGAPVAHGPSKGDSTIPDGATVMDVGRYVGRTFAETALDRSYVCRALDEKDTRTSGLRQFIFSRKDLGSEGSRLHLLTMPKSISFP